MNIRIINDMEKEELSKELFALLHGTGLTVATAESCTGGAVAAAIVATSGASEYFKGGIVAYCNEVKEQLLGVNHDVLVERTAVCEEVAIEMARGARELLKTDFAVSITGTAGPGGGTETIPVGTIWLCVSGKTKVCANETTSGLACANSIDNVCRAAGAADYSQSSEKVNHLTVRLTQDNGRKANLDNAVVAALTLLLRFIAESKARVNE